jgi:hypothetical protein
LQQLASRAAFFLVPNLVAAGAYINGQEIGDERSVMDRPY